MLTCKSIAFVDYRRLSDSKVLELLESHAAIWKSLSAATLVRVEFAVDDVVRHVESQYAGANIIVTGNMYLTGSIRDILMKNPAPD
jgi:hypothetical protein